MSELLEQGLLLPTPPEHNEARMRSFNVDRTPLPVIRQGVPWALRHHQWSAPKRPVILDCAAGEGAFHVVLKELYPDSHRVAVEPREECEKHLRRHAHQVHVGSFLDAANQPLGCLPQADIIAANPPFSDADGKPLWMHFWRACASLLRPGGVLVFLGLNDVGQRGQSDHATFAELWPTAQARIAGPIKFRGVGKGPDGKVRGADMRCYSWWVLGGRGLHSRGPEVAWYTANLPWLPTKDREWRTIPGHEP